MEQEDRNDHYENIVLRPAHGFYNQTDPAQEERDFLEQHGYQGHVIFELDDIGTNIGYETANAVTTKRKRDHDRKRSDLEQWADQILDGGKPLPEQN